MLSSQTVQTPELFAFRVLDLNTVAMFELAEKLYYKLIPIYSSYTTATVSVNALTLTFIIIRT